MARVTGVDGGTLRVRILNDYPLVVKGLTSFPTEEPGFTVVVDTEGGDPADVVLVDPFGSSRPLLSFLPPTAKTDDAKYVVVSFNCSAQAVKQ